jgi:hypothetical protein
MTNEEAIERLKTDIYKYADFKENPNESEFWMAFDMAIKALEQQNVLFKSGLLKDCEACRAEQQPCYNPDEWCHNCKEYDQEKHCCPRYNKVIRSAVEEMKQTKTGHWIYEKRKRLINETDEGAEYVTDYWCKCSKCGGDFGYRKMKDAFCKYCGAKMVESQAESEG